MFVLTLGADEAFAALAAGAAEDEAGTSAPAAPPPPAAATLEEELESAMETHAGNTITRVDSQRRVNAQLAI